MLTKDQVEARRRVIGGSDVPSILGLGYKTPYSVWLEKTGRAPADFEPSKEMQHGNLLESSILDAADQDHPGKNERDVLRASSSVKSLVTRCDMVLESGEPVEAKTCKIASDFSPYAIQFGEEGTDQVPHSYHLQVLAQMECTNAKIGRLYALIGGRGIVRYEIPRNETLIDKIRETCDQFWWHVEHDEPYRIDLATFSDVKAMYRQETAEPVFLSDAYDELLEHLEGIKLAIKSATAEKEEAEKKLLLAMGEEELAETAGGAEISYKLQTRKGKWEISQAELEKLPSDVQEMTRQFGKLRADSSFRVLRIKGGAKR